MTASHVYRFRSGSALLDGFQELERQEIYFSTATEQNDPMEGHRDVVWNGDHVAWRNLFRHYGRLLAIVTPLARIDDQPIDGARYLANAHRIDVYPPTPQLRQGADRAAAAFVAAKPVADTITTLASRSRPIRRDELSFILKALHPHALLAVAREPMSGLTKATDFHATLERLAAGTDNAADQLADVLRSTEAEHAAIYGVAASLARQLTVLSALRSAAPPPSSVTFLMMDVPEAYVAHLEAVLYPPAHSACFVADPGDAAMWSAYADSHRGMCLKFRTHAYENRTCLDLDSVVGWGSDHALETRVIRNFSPKSFSPIDYVAAFPEIEFFTAYGNAPKGVLHRDWHTDGETRSTVATAFDDEDAWRKSHWDRFTTLTLQKTRHWRHEQELRLVLSSVLSDFDKVEDRKATYRFQDLEGVIFGARTPVADVTKALGILQAKCQAEGRDRFELYQARFESSGGAMVFDRLTLLERSICGTTEPVAG